MMNLPYRLILGSKSPRRQELLRSLGYEFRVEVREVDESFPAELAIEELAEFIAKKKSQAFDELQDNELVITSDTVVVCDGKALAKAKDDHEAKEMLRLLSDKTHQVITGVCLKSTQHQTLFSESTLVHFAKLSEKEMDYYIERYQPFDKAGAYGIQEWIGMIGIKGIEGDYYNVMGLPLHKLYKALNTFLEL